MARGHGKSHAERLATPCSKLAQALPWWAAELAGKEGKGRNIRMDFGWQLCEVRSYAAGYPAGGWTAGMRR